MAMTVMLLGACASEGGGRLDDIVRVPFAGQGSEASSYPRPTGVERIQREEALRRDLGAGRASDESTDRCTVNGSIEGC